MRSTVRGMEYVFNHFDMEYNLEKAEEILINGGYEKRNDVWIFYTNPNIVS